MFTSITSRQSFGATYQWAILSVLPMDDGDDGMAQDGMRPTDINAALGLPNEARTGLSMLLKVMAEQGLIKRHELGARWVEYTRLMPLRNREGVFYPPCSQFVTLDQSLFCHHLEQHRQTRACFVRQPQSGIDVSGAHPILCHAIVAVIHREN